MNHKDITTDGVPVRHYSFHVLFLIRQRIKIKGDEKKSKFVKGLHVTDRLECMTAIGSQELRRMLNLSPLDIHIVPSLPPTQ